MIEVRASYSVLAFQKGAQKPSGAAEGPGQRSPKHLLFDARPPGSPPDPDSKRLSGISLSEARTEPGCIVSSAGQLPSSGCSHPHVPCMTCRFYKHSS